MKNTLVPAVNGLIFAQNILVELRGLKGLRKMAVKSEKFDLAGSRKKLGLLQSEMAAKMGHSLRTYQELERGKRSVRRRHSRQAEAVMLEVAAETGKFDLLSPLLQERVNKLAPVNGSDGEVPSDKLTSKRTRSERPWSENSVRPWQVFVPANKKIEVGSNFKAFLLVAHNCGPGKISIRSAIGTEVELSANGVHVMQVEYCLTFTSLENKSATLEFDVVPVAPWSFWSELYKASSPGATASVV
jgi:DNA-binding XRE family transcriptional regulator